MLFDSHSHLHFSQYDSDREEVIGRLKEAGIGVINIGTDLYDSKKAIELAKKYPDFMWASIGLHPNSISTTNRRSSENGIIEFDDNLQINRLKELAKDEKVIAIGECGLDYYHGTRNMKHGTNFKERPAQEGRGSLNIIERQKEIFIKQIELAKELDKPLILHCRPSVGSQDAYEDAVEILNTKYQILNTNKGVVHFFSGSKETAKKFLDLGFYISFAGPITFASEYREVVEFVPIDRILIETDAPFAAPVPYRGKRNEPAYVEFVARQIAQWKGLNFDKVATQTHNNAKALFKI